MRQKRTRGRSYLLLVCIACTVGVFALDLQLPLGVAGGVPYAAVILLSLCGSNGSRSTLSLAFWCSILTVLGFYLSEPAGILWMVLFNRVLALFVIWTTALLGLRLKWAQRERVLATRQRHEAQSRSKILQGLLPICSACKKIRDKSGQWDNLESYIADHSEADFTHSVCPGCAKELYNIGEQVDSTASCGRSQRLAKEYSLTSSGIKRLTALVSPRDRK